MYLVFAILCSLKLQNIAGIVVNRSGLCFESVVIIFFNRITESFYIFFLTKNVLFLCISLNLNLGLYIFSKMLLFMAI